MADEQVEQEAQQEEVRTYTQAEVDELVQGLKAKNEELLGESKTAKQKAQELSEAQRQAEEQRLAEKQEFKTLYEREQEAKRKLQEQYEEFEGRIKKTEIERASQKVASELTRDTARAELLQEKIAQHARYNDDGSVKFEMGGVEVEHSKVVEQIRERYPFLVDGSQASGGGASGAGGRATDGSKISRSDFDSMGQMERAKFFKSGGKVVDE